MRGTRTPLFVGAICFGLFLFLNTALGVTLVPFTNTPTPSNGWAGVACSADGTKLVAGIYGGAIYTSTDSGATWISNSAPVRNWYSVASSADGTKLAAVAYSGNGQVWTNSGTTWYPTPSPSGSFASYDSIACSADGTKLITAAAILPGGHFVFTSPDSGTTWNTANLPNNLSWFSVASSADGTKLAAFAENTGAMYTSSDSGTTWVSNSVPNLNWIDVCSSADGNRLVAVALSGPSYRSADSGATWVSNAIPGTGYALASSSDGSHIIVVGGGAFYTSTDFGQTWISNSSPAAVIQHVACSADGTKGIASGATGSYPNLTAALYGIVPGAVTPPLLSLLSSNSQFAVAWPSSVSGFQLQQNTNLSTANWSNVTSPVLLSNGMNEVIISPGNAANFYRLISQ